MDFHSITSLFNSYTSANIGAIKQSIIELFQYLSVYPRFAKLSVTDSEIDVLTENFLKIGQFFQIPFDSLRIENSTQRVESTNFVEIFKSIKMMNVHQNVNSDKYDAAYPKVVKQPKCSCEFHEEELFDHLHVCSIVAGIHAARNGENIFQVMLTGLLHDVGKPACIKIFDKGNVGYPYHGEYGSIILSRVFVPEFEKFLSMKEYEQMCRAIAIHMCSYHITDFQSNWSQARVNSTRMESQEVKNIINCLSFGDVFGAFSDIASHDDFIKSRVEYSELIKMPFETNKNKIVFLVRGRSGSGKSYIAQHLIESAKKLGLTCTHIQRDVIIANTVRKLQGETEIDFRPVAEQYAKYYSYYKDNKLGAQVNQEMQKKIEYSINTFDSIIIDTQMSLFRGFDQIIPQNISNCIIISLDISRNIPIDNDSKNGIGIQEQLALFGNTSTLFPFDLAGTNIFALSAAYTHNQKPVGISSDFVFAIGYNKNYFGDKSIGLNHFNNFMENIVSQITKLPAIESLSLSIDDMNLVEYVNHLYKANNNDYDAIVTILRSQYYQVGSPSQFKGTPVENQFLSIKYLDHNNNWNKWGRESRGTTLVLIDGEWTWLKFLMQRGAEMLTGLQMKRGIDKTDNIDTKMDFKASHLAKSQQELIQDLREGNPIDLVVSFKKDGSLLSCCIFSGGFAKMMRSLIIQFGDKFTNTVMTEYDKISGSDDVFVFQSQSTLFLGDAMHDYTTTAIFPHADPKLTPNDKIKTYGSDFFTRMKSLFDSLDKQNGYQSDVKQILGETICADRKESYSGKVHSELAMSYPESSFTILSATIIHNKEYEVKQHYKFSDLIAANGFIEPAFWRVQNVDKVDALIKSVDDYIFKNIDLGRFYYEHPPSNEFGYEKVIDCEGFVTYDLMREDSYGKIKTDSYYKSHKLRNDNIEFLCNLNKVAGHIFPLARIVDETISQLDAKLQLINPELIALISSANMIGKLPEKASRGFSNRPKDVQCKIIINTAKDSYAKLAFEIFQKYFPSLVVSDYMTAFVVNYSMKTELWLDQPKQIDSELKSFIVAQIISNSS
jgi:hypothetical protein